MRKKLIGLFMAAAMSISLATSLPATSAQAADGADDGFVTSKTAELQDNGTYTITLEGYATGEEVRTVTTEHVATDVTLVLDVSGSMDEEIAYGAMTNLDGLDKDAPEGYYYTKVLILGSYPLRYKDGEWQYKRKVQWPWEDPWTNVDGATFEDWIKNNDRPVYITKINATKLAVNRFIREIHNDAVANNVDHNISIVKYSGAYQSSSHLREGNNTGKTELVKNYLTAKPDANISTLTGAVSSLVEDGATYADYGMQIAKEVVNQSSYKDNGHAKVVVMFTDGEPNHGSGFTTAVANTTIATSKDIKTVNNASVYTVGLYNPKDLDSKMATYMSYVSSNYPTASSMTNGGTQAASNFYLNANTAGGLDEIFKTIATEAITGGAIVKADATTVVKDIISNKFVAPNASSVKTFTVDVDPNASKSADQIVFKNTMNSVSLTTSVKGNEISVTGFDFAENWCGKDGYNNYRGKKLVVVIENVLPNADAFTGEAVNTNADGSGVFAADKVKEIEEFEKPAVTLLNKAVVVDYAKKLELTGANLGLNTVAKFLNNNTLGTNVPSLTYGKLSKEGNKLYFTPNTTSWTGSDVVCAFGNDADNKVAWSKATIMPATNVYYEDTFTTSASDGRVGIVYGGTWSKGTEGGAAGSTTADGVNGWLDSLKEATGVTDGSITSADSSQGSATATINFTGTGLDVYTKTDLNSGMIIAKLTATDGRSFGTKLLKVYNESKSGTYYSVPTLSFSDLPYGAYKLIISVSADAATREKGQYEYSIDGIRIYNPNQANTAKFFNLVDQISDSDKIFVDEENKVTSVAAAEEVGSDNLGKGEIAQNEVLLKDAASVSFKVSGGEEYYIGMKSLTGASVTAHLSNGKVDQKSEVSLEHTADMYYKITPDANGVVTISNTGSGVLALTKLQAVGSDVSAASFSLVTDEAAVEQAARFARFAPVAYSLAPETEEEIVAPEEDVKAPEVVITEPEEKEPETSKNNSAVSNIISSIFGGFKKIFGR